MGRTYLTVEPADPDRREAVRAAVEAYHEAVPGDPVTATESWVGGKRYDADLDRVEATLSDLGAAFDRALAVTVGEAGSRVGRARLYVRADGRPLLVEETTGNAGGGGDIVDYARRHHGIDGLPRELPA